jgi:hypothetical protein
VRLRSWMHEHIGRSKDSAGTEMAQFSDSIIVASLADDVAQRRKLAETPFLDPYGGAKVFLRAAIGPPRRPVGDWHIACGNCGNPVTARRASPAQRLDPGRARGPMTPDLDMLRLAEEANACRRICTTCHSMRSRDA